MSEELKKLYRKMLKKEAVYSFGQANSRFFVCFKSSESRLNRIDIIYLGQLNGVKK